MTGYSFSTNPVCFYPGQTAQQFRMAHPMFSVQSPIMQTAGGKYVVLKELRSFQLKNFLVLAKSTVSQTKKGFPEKYFGIFCQYKNFPCSGMFYSIRGL